jgi:hypothetical protein
MLCIPMSFVAILVLGLLLVPLGVNAQTPAKVPRIGVLWSGSPTPGLARRNDALYRMRELRYVM